MTAADRKNIFQKPLSQEYRDEMRALLAEKPPEPPKRAGSTLVFELGGLRLALPARIASAVAPILHIARIPHRSGTVLLGLAAFRGDLLPCCSLARLLELEHHQGTSARTLILEESAGRRWAVPIDGVSGVRNLEHDDVALEGTPPIASQWIARVLRDEQGELYLLNQEHLFRQIMLATA